MLQMDFKLELAFDDFLDFQDLDDFIVPGSELHQKLGSIHK